MKRLMVVIPALLLLISLLGCNASTRDAAGTQDPFLHAANKLASAENSRALILLSVNPSFEIYSGDSGIIQRVAAANEDAKKVLSGKDYQGVSVNACIPELLDIMRQLGFLKDGGQVSISTYVHEDAFPSFDYRQQIEDLLVSYTGASGINITYSNTLDVISKEAVGSVPPGAGDSAPSTSADPDAPTLTLKYDTDGSLIEIFTFPNGDFSERHYDVNNIVEMVLEGWADGSRTETWYDATGRTIKLKCYDTSGQCTFHEEWVYRADGHTRFFYDGITGVRTYEEVLTPDGKTCCFYDAATGALISEELCTPEGKTIQLTTWLDMGLKEIQYFGEDGALTRFVQQNADGSGSDTQYHKNGRSENLYVAGGILLGAHEFDLDGVMTASRTYNATTGALEHDCTYENGVMTRWLWVDPNNQVEHVLTYANGKQTQEQIFWNGVHGLASEFIICDAEGYYSVGTVYYTDGRTLINTYGVDKDGEYLSSESHYDSSGVLTEQYFFGSRAEWVAHYLGDNPGI